MMMPLVHVSPLWQTNLTFAPTHVYRQETKYAITPFASVTHVHTSLRTHPFKFHPVFPQI